MFKTDKPRQVALPDGTEVFVKKPALSCMAFLQRVQESGGADTDAIAEVIMRCVVNEDGTALKEFKGKKAADVADMLDMETAAHLSALIMVGDEEDLGE